MAWVKTYWYIPLVVLGSAILWFAGSRKLNPWKRLYLETSAADSAARAKELEIESGAEVATQKIETEHKATLEALDEKQKKKAVSLRGKPSALARYLVRVGGDGTL